MKYSIVPRRFDTPLFILVLALSLIGLITLYPILDLTNSALFYKQTFFVLSAFVLIPLFASLDYSLLRSGWLSQVLYLSALSVLALLLIFAPIVSGTSSWIDLGIITIQPVEFAKICLIIILAKYFESRHIYIKHIKHIFISAILMSLIFVLIYLQPDLGSASVILLIWVGMIIVSGVSKKHLLAITLLGIAACVIGWQFLAGYQQDRIRSFIHPLEDIYETGYNANQSKIAIGSGGLIGKGITEGTQSKLSFLPTYETDFIFASFAEEWGFMGVIMMFMLFGLLFYRLITFSLAGQTNFESLFIIGVAISLAAHIFIHIGANVGILPVTGLTMPFISYGGSHLFSEFIMIGMAMGMNKRR